MVNHMVEDEAGMDLIFHALAHTARRDMLRRLAGGPRTIGELAGPLTMSFAAASKHVKVLETAGLISRTVDGRRHVCTLVAQPLADATRWLTFYQRHWQTRLDALEDLLRENP